MHARGGYVVVAADLLALTLLAPPGEWGADVVVGSTQRFGVPMGYGGPHAGYLATRDEFKRSMPGRLVGVTVDAARQPGVPARAADARAAHPPREGDLQHLHRAGAARGDRRHVRGLPRRPTGLTTIARRVHRLAGDPEGRASSGWASRVPTARVLRHDHRRDRRAHAAIRRARRRARRQLPPRRRARRSASRSTRRRRAPTSSASGRSSPAATRRSPSPSSTPRAGDALPAALARTSPFLTHPVFHRYHSETEMLRYLRRLADHDIALDRAMIPLGSCTMKLNATTEMIPVTWPRVRATCTRSRRPTRPQGYRELIARPRADAVRDAPATRRCRCSPTPARRASTRACSRSAPTTRAAARAHRDVCLIPASAHGTNPASAQMAGMQVVVVACDDGRQRRPRRPRGEGARSTRASSPRSWSPIRRRTACSRRASGASARSSTRTAGRSTSTARTSTRWSASRAPGEFGADVSHLNLHKTFCIPHGGGGPGVGPIGGRRASRAVPAGPPRPARTASAATRSARGRRRAVRQRVDPADLVDVHHDDGRRRASPRRPRARSSPPTTSRGASRRTIRCSTRARAGSSRTSASSTCGR